MKKLMLSLAAVLTVALFAACGGGSASYTEFKDDAKGFSFEVPGGLEQYTGPEAMGAIQFRLDGKILNGVSADVRENIMGDYDHAKIDEDFNEASLGLSDNPTKEKTADGYIIKDSFKDMGRNAMQKVIYKGAKCYTITVYWEDENESKYGGEVAQHVIDSFKPAN